MASKSNKNGLHLVENKEKEKKSGRSKFMISGSVIILILIAVTFIGAPAITSFTNTSNRLIFGYYNKKPIEYRADNYFSRQRDSIAEQYRESMSSNDSGFNLDFQLYQIWRQAFEATVTHVGLLDMAEEAGVYFTDDQIDNQIVTAGPYMDSNGQFDENAYLNTSNTLRKTNRMLISQEMLKNEVISGVFGSKISTAEKDFINAMNYPEKKFRYAVFPYSSYPSDIISAYAAENSSIFKRISLSRIFLTESEEKALEVHAAVTSDPSTFEEEARNQSEDSFASKGGSMGAYVYHELRIFFDDTEDLDRIMNLNAGEVSDLIVNEDGWYIYKCDEPASSLDMDNPEDLENVRVYIQRYERGSMEDFFTEKGIEFINIAEGENGTFTGAADSLNIEYHDTEFFPVVYGNPGFSFYGNNFPLFTPLSVADEDTTLQYVSSDAHVLKTMAGLNEIGDISSPLILDEAVVVLELLEQNTEPEDEAEEATAGMYYDYAVNSWKQNLLAQGFLTSDKLEDNFYEEFGKLLND